MKNHKELLIPLLLLLIGMVQVACGGGGGNNNDSPVLTALTYSANPAIYTKGVPITANTPTVTGGVATSFTVSPNLPAGLGLDSTTGVITGTPTGISDATSCIVTATTAKGSATATLSITCLEPANYYVAPWGKDDNLGDAKHPFASFEKAHSVASPGNLIYFRGGTYHPIDPTKTINMLTGRNGTADAVIRFWAHPGEKVVFDFSTISTTTKLVRAIIFTGDYWHWKGIDITGAPQYQGQSMSNAFRVADSHHSIFERMCFRDNDANAFAMTGSSSDNLVLNCDAYNNQDPIDSYENANGFMSVTNAGTTNTFRGCRAWWNADDGFDHFNGNGVVIHEECWAFWNGYKPGTFEKAGNGMGFKFGISSSSQGIVTRVATNSVAFKNRSWGFDQNALMDAIRLQNCTAHENAYGIRLPHHPELNLRHVVQNCLAYGNKDEAFVTSNSINDHNSWNSSVTVTDADFLSLDSTGIDGPRGADGSLPVLSYLRLAPGSDLIDKGVDVDLNYLGAAPDLGAFERK